MLNRFLETSREIADNLLFPIECLGCEKPGHFLCQECLNSLKICQELVCPVCEYPSLVGATHLRCASPQMINGIFIAGDFRDELLKATIKKLKYKNVQLLAQPLAEFLAKYYLQNFGSWLTNLPWTLTSTPLHPRRLKQRGFNQSELVAKALSGILQIPYLETLARIKETTDQTKLSKDERKLNVENAFTKIPEVLVRGQNFLIVDDVCTTGSTLKQCAKMLKRHGAGLVWGLALARD